MKKLVSIVLLCMVCSMAQATLLTYVTSDAADATTIRPGQLSQVSSILVMVGDTTTVGDIMRGVVEVDLGSPELDGAVINSLSIKWNQDTIDGTSVSGNLDLTIHEVSPFDATQATWTDRYTDTAWATAGGDYGTVLDTQTANPRNYTSVTFSSQALADAAQSVIDAGQQKLYLLIKLDGAAESDGARTIFRFKDNAAIAIDYTAAVPEPATMLLLGMGAVTLAVRRKK